MVEDDGDIWDCCEVWTNVLKPIAQNWNLMKTKV